MKRTRLGVDDFEPLKVIGRGAFGEVSSVYLFKKEMLITHSRHISLSQVVCVE